MPGVDLKSHGVSFDVYAVRAAVFGLCMCVLRVYTQLKVLKT